MCLANILDSKYLDLLVTQVQQNMSLINILDSKNLNIAVSQFKENMGLITHTKPKKLELYSQLSLRKHRSDKYIRPK